MTDTEYVALRDAQIPLAVLAANREACTRGSDYQDVWNVAFHRAMNALTSEALTGCSDAQAPTGSNRPDLLKAGLAGAGPRRIAQNAQNRPTIDESRES